MKYFLTIFVCLASVFLASIYFSKHGTTDMDIWLMRISYIQQWGPLNAYHLVNTNKDYLPIDAPPLFMFYLFVSLKIAELLNVSYILGMKILLLIFYILSISSFILLSIIKKHNTGGTTFKNAISSLILILSVPYLLFSSLAYSYLDVFFTPFLVLSVISFIKKRWILAGVFITISSLTKWFTVLLIPLYAIYFINFTKFKNRSRIIVQKTGFIKILLGILLVSASILAMFIANNINPVNSLITGFRTSAVRPYVSGLAMNLGWIETYFIRVFSSNRYGGLLNGQNLLIYDRNFPYRTTQSILYYSVILLILVKFFLVKKTIRNWLYVLFLVSFTYFVLSFGVHENHLVMAVLTSLCLAIFTNRFRYKILYVYIATMGLLNLVWFMGIPLLNSTRHIGIRFIGGVDISLLFAILNVIVNLSLLTIYFKNDRNHTY